MSKKLSAHDEAQLCALIDSQIRVSVGHYSGQMALERARAIDYYQGKPFGDEREGESQVVSTDVFDAIEGMLPALLRIFTASDDAVEFQARGPEDEAEARQRTDVCNYVFYGQNNGFLTMYEWFKDALMCKNGIVKYWWDERVTKAKEEYESLTDVELAKLLSDPAVVVLEQEDRPDEDAQAQIAQKLEQLQAQFQQTQDSRIPAMIAQIQALPVPMLHDVEIERTKNESKVCIACVPPEEFGISYQARNDIQEAPFVYHRRRSTRSELIELGYDKSKLDELGTEEHEDLSPEYIARRALNSDVWPERTGEYDLQSAPIWITEAYIRTDLDEDGVAELVKVVKCANVIFEQEECERIPFACIAPILMPHRWSGISIADVSMDIQYLNSHIWRQMLNNLYLANNPRKVVLSNASGAVQANLDDLLNSRVGGVVREYQPNAVRDLVTPWVAGQSFPMLEYQESRLERRTGVTRYNQGTDADTLNKTAHGIQLIQNAGQQRLDLIARIFAEVGVKELFRGIVWLLSKYGYKDMAMRLRGQYVNIDPREWKTHMDMTVNVGLGTGNKDAQLVHLAKMGEYQMLLMKEGRGYMVSDENVYNLGRKMAENMGFKHPELFMSDPATVQKPQPQPNPDVIKIQQEGQIAQSELQLKQWAAMMDAKVAEAAEQIKAQTAISVANIERQTKLDLEATRQRHGAQMEVYKTNANLIDAAKELDTREIKVSTEEQLLALKKQMDSMVAQHQNDLTVQSDGKHAAVGGQMMQAVTQGMQQVAQEIAGVAQLLTQMQTVLIQTQQQSAMLAEQTVEAILKPKSVSIGNVVKNEAGEIVGAQVTPTLQ